MTQTGTTPQPLPLADASTTRLAIDAIRVLSMDAVQAAESGHPGAPMGLAPAGYLLWRHHLRHNPRNPRWPNRDRFVLSAGHASMLLYSLLHLTGYDLSLAEIKDFRQWGSRTPGHPEYRETPGVETFLFVMDGNSELQVRPQAQLVCNKPLSLCRRSRNELTWLDLRMYNVELVD